MSFGVNSVSSASAANSLESILTAMNKTSFKDGTTINKNLSDAQDNSAVSASASSYDSTKLDKHISMMNKLQEVMLQIKENGSEISDADSARLQALNISQQLSNQPLSIANASSDEILSLF